MEIEAGDIVFIDTNILLTATDTSRENHQRAKNIFASALDTGFHLCFSGQIIREYLAVATRDVGSNGLGLPPEKALSNITEFKSRMIILEETEDTVRELLELVRTHQLKGHRVHDANIVAAMKTHTVKKLITENARDFETFADILIMGPAGIDR